MSKAAEVYTTKAGRTFTCVATIYDLRPYDETFKAIRVNGVWLPKSQSFIKWEYQGCGVNKGKVFLKQWLLEEKCDEMNRVAIQKEFDQLIEDHRVFMEMTAPEEFSSLSFQKRVGYFLKDLRTTREVYLDLRDCRARVASA